MKCGARQAQAAARSHILDYGDPETFVGAVMISDPVKNRRN
jgi:hypothetical protein